jgi:hypothetical protein
VSLYKNPQFSDQKRRGRVVVHTKGIPTQTVLVGLGKRSNCLFYNPIIIKYDFIKVLKYIKVLKHQNQVKGF